MWFISTEGLHSIWMETSIIHINAVLPSTFRFETMSTRGGHCTCIYTCTVPLGTSFNENEVQVLHKITWTSMILSSLELFRPEFDVKIVTMDQNCVVTLKINVLRIVCQVISPKFNWTPLLYKLKISTRWKPGHSRFYICSQGTVGMYCN